MALGVGAAAWWGYGQYRLQQHWQAAQDAIEHHDAWTAYDELRPCLSAWSERAEVLLAAARAARLAGMIDDAEAHLTACERLAPSDDDVQFERMLLQAQQGDLRPYEETLRRLSDEPGDRQNAVLMALAQGLADTLQTGEAAMYLERIAARDPDYLPMLLLSAEVRVRHERFAEARPYLDRAFGLAPQGLGPRLRLAECMLQQGEVQGAEEHLRELYDRYPAHAQVLFDLARCRIYRNDMEAACGYLDQVLDNEPRHVEALLERGRLELRVSAARAAQQWLRQALEINSQNLGALQALEAACRAVKDSEAAQTYRQRAEKLQIELGQLQRLKIQASQEAYTLAALRDLGRRWHKLHNPREAQKYFFNALQLDPHDKDTHRELAAIFDESGQPHRAARHRALADGHDLPELPYDPSRFAKTALRSNRSSSAPRAELPDEAGSEAVHAYCALCHVYPSPDTFPRGAWREEIRKAFDRFRDANLQAPAPDLEGVVRYYEKRAPERFRSPAPEPSAVKPLPIPFKRESLRPSQCPAAPGVTNVQLAPLFNKNKLDLIVCHTNPGRIWAVDLYNEKPTWRLVCDTLLAPCHVEAVDLDGDGHMDLLVAELGSFYPTNDRTGQVVWLRGDSTGKFTPQVLLDGVGRVADVQAADLNGDGKLDLVVAVFGWRQGGILYLENQTTDWAHPQFAKHVLDDRAGAIHVPIGDLNGDGKPDIVALISQEHETVVAFLNEGGARFAKKTIYQAPHPAYGSSGIQFVDLNGDGKLDVLYTNGDILDPPYILKPYHGIQWLENRGSFPFEHHHLAQMHGAMRAVAADFTGSGRKDIVAVSFLPPEEYPERKALQLPSVLFLEQVAPGKFARHVLETATCDHLTCVAGDIHGEGRQTLVTGNFYMTPGLGQRDLVTVWRDLRGAKK